MKYEAHIYGKSDEVEEEYNTFRHLFDAVKRLERKTSSDHDGWEFQDGKLRLVDYNHGGPVVIQTIKPVEEPPERLEEGTWVTDMSDRLATVIEPPDEDADDTLHKVRIFPEGRNKSYVTSLPREALEVDEDDE